MQERGAKIRLRVKSIKKKRLLLDFTQETIDLSQEENANSTNEATEEDVETSQPNTKAIEESPQVENEIQESDEESIDSSYDEYSDPYYDEAAAWAAYAEDNYADEEDDEDKNIEDALGIGYY